MTYLRFTTVFSLCAALTANAALAQTLPQTLAQAMPDTSQAILDTDPITGLNVPEGATRGLVTGTITFVKGHLVTVQQATRTVVINDKPALDSQKTGKVAVGRQIVAYGYWQGDNFYATRIE
jgi:hypothetical protein